MAYLTSLISWTSQKLDGGSNPSAATTEVSAKVSLVFPNGIYQTVSQIGGSNVMISASNLLTKLMGLVVPSIYRYKNYFNWAVSDSWLARELCKLLGRVRIPYGPHGINLLYMRIYRAMLVV